MKQDVCETQMPTRETTSIDTHAYVKAFLKGKSNK
jgi:hypothetical protein